MGLDATWYRGLKKRDDVVFDGDGEPTNVDRYFRPYANPDFPGREGSLDHKAVYEYEGAGDAWSGAYSRYSRWREWLAKVAGYPLLSYKEYGRDQPSYCVACWNGASGPFSELINFSDCEGVIGPEIAAKLAKDFEAFDGIAKSSDEEDFYARYQAWRTAFEQAALNGAVAFH